MVQYLLHNNLLSSFPSSCLHCARDLFDWIAQLIISFATKISQNFKTFANDFIMFLFDFHHFSQCLPPTTFQLFFFLFEFSFTVKSKIKYQNKRTNALQCAFPYLIKTSKIKIFLHKFSNKDLKVIEHEIFIFLYSDFLLSDEMTLPCIILM